VQTVSEAGTVENQYDYDIFGNPTLTIEVYAASIRYAGEFFDTETGLYYLRARYYDPYVGRFISEDTYEGKINDPLSLNRYTYAHNDPIMYVDPTGHAATKNNATVLLKDVVKDGYGGSLYWDNKNKTATVNINGQKITIKTEGKDAAAAVVNGRVIIKPDTLDRLYNAKSNESKNTIKTTIDTSATAKEITAHMTIEGLNEKPWVKEEKIKNNYDPIKEFLGIITQVSEKKKISYDQIISLVNITKFECQDLECGKQTKSNSSSSTTSSSIDPFEIIRKIEQAKAKVASGTASFVEGGVNSLVETGEGLYETGKIFVTGDYERMKALTTDPEKKRREAEALIAEFNEMVVNGDSDSIFKYAGGLLLPALVTRGMGKAVPKVPKGPRDPGKSGADNIAQYAKYQELLKAEEAANPLVDSLRQTGQLPSNYVTKTIAEQNGWKPGKALNNYVSGGQLGGDVFQNTTKILPDAPGRIWYEADIGLSNTMSRSKQPGTRLLYSNDGKMYITVDHYETVNFIGTYK